MPHVCFRGEKRKLGVAAFQSSLRRRNQPVTDKEAELRFVDVWNEILSSFPREWQPGPTPHGNCSLPRLSRPPGLSPTSWRLPLPSMSASTWFQWNNNIEWGAKWAAVAYTVPSPPASGTVTLPFARVSLTCLAFISTAQAKRSPREAKPSQVLDLNGHFNYSLLYLQKFY